MPNFQPAKTQLPKASGSLATRAFVHEALQDHEAKVRKLEADLVEHQRVTTEKLDILFTVVKEDQEILQLLGQCIIDLQSTWHFRLGNWFIRAWHRLTKNNIKEASAPEEARR